MRKRVVEIMSELIERQTMSITPAEASRKRVREVDRRRWC